MEEAGICVDRVLDLATSTEVDVALEADFVFDEYTSMVVAAAPRAVAVEDFLLHADLDAEDEARDVELVAATGITVAVERTMIGVIEDVVG